MGRVEVKKSKKKEGVGKSSERSKLGRKDSSKVWSKQKGENHKGKGTDRKDVSSKRDEPSIKKSKRSKPGIEYSLSDATPEERELIKNGGINDRINTLTLLCARNPSPENYKQLLFFTKDQRNDVIYLVIKNLRDLLKEKPVADPYIKGRIIKSYEMGMKNQYIKNMVIEIVGVLIRAGIYEEEFIGLLVERLGEKGETLRLVHQALWSVFGLFEALIIQSTEDFYFKNDNFRSQYMALRFLRGAEPRDASLHFAFYNTALTTLDQAYFDDQRDILMGEIVHGLASCYTPGSSVDRIDRIRDCVNSVRATIPSLELLMKMRDEQLAKFILRVAKGMCLRNSTQECSLLNAIERVLDEGLADGVFVLRKLIDSCFYYNSEYIISLLLIAAKRNISAQHSYLLLVRHYHPIVRSVASAMLRGATPSFFDPYDRVLMNSMLLTVVSNDT